MVIDHLKTVLHNLVLKRLSKWQVLKRFCNKVEILGFVSKISLLRQLLIEKIVKSRNPLNQKE